MTMKLGLENGGSWGEVIFPDPFLGPRREAGAQAECTDWFPHYDCDYWMSV